MPRVGLRVSLIAWRVPNETRAESVARICAAEISAIAAASVGLLLSPRLELSMPAVGIAPDWAETFGDPAVVTALGAHDAAATMPTARRASAFRCMLCYPDGDGCNGSMQGTDCLR